MVEEEQEMFNKYILKEKIKILLHPFHCGSWTARQGLEKKFESFFNFHKPELRNSWIV